MQDDEFGVHANGGFERLEGVLESAFALAPVLGRKLVEVRRGAVHADGQGAEVVQAGDLDFARVHRFKNPR